MKRPDRSIKRGPGRPPVKDWPDQIPDTPTNVLRAVLTMPTLRREQWNYMNAKKNSTPKVGE